LLAVARHERKGRQKVDELKRRVERALAYERAQTLIPRLQPRIAAYTEGKSAAYWDVLAWIKELEKGE
jgi:hypothetical protein